MSPETLEKINKFTRREFTEDELYVFSVILCDNDIDRDGERFSDAALESLKSLFIGKTGISDHDPSSANQTARIFDTELVTDSSRTSRSGEPYKYLRAMAYMVRTDDNRDIITQIDGGIRKEVSISCSAGRKVCSVCGGEDCAHVRGKSYGGVPCHQVLDDITDAYEWSFVAVPAQVNAGVTKRFLSGTEEKPGAEDTSADNELRRDIRRLAWLSGGRTAAAAAEVSARGLDTQGLIRLKKAYEKLSRRPGEMQVQLMPEEDSGQGEFSMKDGRQEDGNEYRIG